MSGHVKIFRNKSKDKKKNNGLVCFCIDNNKLLEKYKTIWTKTKDLQNIELFTKLKWYINKNQNKSIWYLTFY